MLDALADREDVGARRLHVVVDDDAALDLEAGRAPELDVRPDAGGHDHEIGVDALAVRERDAFHLAVAEIAFVLWPSSTRTPSDSILRVR